MIARPPGAPARAGGVALLHWALPAVAAAGLALLYALDLDQYLSPEALRRSQASVTALVDQNLARAALAYVVVYAASVAVSFPGASALTIAGGLLFGAVLGALLAMAAATLGATLIFLIARSSLGELLAARAGPRMHRLRTGFQDDAFFYLLFLRLVPLFPFWLVNLAAALFGMRLIPYVAATAVGILPGAFILSYLGQGLAGALENNGPVLSTELVVALALLGAIALVPVILRRRRRRDRQAPPG